MNQQVTTDGNQIQVANQVELGAETELTTEEHLGDANDPSSTGPRTRTRTRSNNKSS